MPSNADLLTGYQDALDYDFVSQHSGRYKTFKRYLKKIKSHSGMTYASLRFLDIGSASGSFLAAAKNKGAVGLGIEPNKFLANWGRENYGVNIHVGGLNSFDFSYQYNCVTFWDVLEHLVDPVLEITPILNKLPKGGFLILSLPDTDSFYSRYFKRLWPMVLDVHLTYFNQKSLTFLLKSHNLSMIYKSNYFQTLDLNYIIYRILLQLNIKPLNNYLPKILKLVPRTSFTYYVGQKFYIFKKNND